MLEKLLDVLPRPRWGSYTVWWSGDSSTRRIEGAETAAWGVPRESAVKAWYEAKGWIVKGGGMYGCDYVLYRGDPDTHHSEYGVLVTTPADPPTWQHLSGLARVLESVRKDLCVCVCDESSGVAVIKDFSMTRHVAAERGGGAKRGAREADDEGDSRPAKRRAV